MVNAILLAKVGLFLTLITLTYALENAIGISQIKVMSAWVVSNMIGLLMLIQPMKQHATKQIVFIMIINWDVSYWIALGFLNVG